jgi:peptidoglycan/xylan/chitin deacetylase (PgdA/CDA1 family)/GT2 family glycosyltransferase
VGVAMIMISIIISTRNRALKLRRCLEALARQTQPAADYEVIVVDDGSTDLTQAMLQSFSAPYQLRSLRQAWSREGAARNRGVSVASGRYCLFLDDDVLAAPGLIAEHLRALRENEEAVGIGRLTMTPPYRDWFAARYAEVWKKHYDDLTVQIRKPTWEDCYGGNLSLSREAFLTSGGFSPGLLAEHDVEFGYRLGRMGVTFTYIPGAVGEHEDYKDFRGLASYLERHGSGSVKVSSLHPCLMPSLLGGVSEPNLPVRSVCRFLLGLNVPPIYLGFVGPLLSRTHWNDLWYATVYMYCFSRGVRTAMPDKDSFQRLMYVTPILMYHAFGLPGERPSRFIMPIERFARQMAWLKRMGYRSLSLDEYLNCRRENRLPPVRSVVITMDDGYKDNLTLAYPVLRANAFEATFFVVGGLVGAANQWSQRETRSELAGRPLMTWDDLRELVKRGMRIGAHTRTHPKLASLSHEQMKAEVIGSRRDLEDALQAPVTTFAYPYGEIDVPTRSIVEEAGFIGACGIQSGRNTLMTPLFDLRRTELLGTDSFLGFTLKLLFGTKVRPFRH